MKKLFLSLLVCASVQLAAQSDQTIFSDIHRIGAFGAPIFDFGDFDSDVTTANGGGGALILNDFFIGGYGIGSNDFTKIVNDTTETINFGHGGFWLGLTPKQSKTIHPYISMRLGWGDVDSKVKNVLDPGNPVTYKNIDKVFVLTPEIGFEVNVFSFFRIAASANYRWVNGLTNLQNFEDSDLSNFGATLTLKFGGFGSYWWD